MGKWETDIFNSDWTMNYWEFIWLIIRKVIRCLSLNRTRVLVLKFPWENKKGSCYVTTTMYMYSTELCPFIATSGPPSSVLLEYFRYYTRAHALLYYDSKPQVYANHILDFFFYFFLTSKPLTLQVSDAAGLDLWVNYKH